MFKLFILQMKELRLWGCLSCPSLYGILRKKLSCKSNFPDFWFRDLMCLTSWKVYLKIIFSMEIQILFSRQWKMSNLQRKGQIPLPTWKNCLLGSSGSGFTLNLANKELQLSVRAHWQKWAPPSFLTHHYPIPGACTHTQPHSPNVRFTANS